MDAFPQPSFVTGPPLPVRPMLPRLATRRPVQAIARKVADIRHYPAGTDKEGARKIRAKEKREVRKRREKERVTPSGFGDRPGAGIFPYGSAERTRAERSAYHARMDPKQREASLRFIGMLSGGQADMLMHTLRARYLERVELLQVSKPLKLTEDVISIYDLLIEEILLCDSLYYCDDPKPRISDEQYDELVMHLIELERCFPQLIQARSPSQNVGHGAAARSTKLALDNEVFAGESPVLATSSFTITVPVTTKLFPQHRHKALMLSLDNAYDYDQLSTFFKRATEAGSSISAELKIDGVALSLEYRNRKLHLAATRGTGRLGDEITTNVREALSERGIPDTIDDPSAPDWLLVRGEVFITPSDLIAVNASLERPLSNPRNAAAGALKHKDPAEAKERRLRFIGYECLTGKLSDADEFGRSNHPSDGLPPTQYTWSTQEETLSNLARWGFGKMPLSETCPTQEDAELFAAGVVDGRESLPMEVDGVVFKLNDSAAREELGNTARAPRGAVAYKFAAQARVTKVNDVVMQVSRNGVITPVAILEPVKVGGAVLSRATLHNFDEIQRLGVAVGDEIRVERGGDVIPKVLSVVRRSEDEDREQIEPPDRCPSCQGEVRTKIERSGAVLVLCKNKENCTAQTFGRLIHFSGRDAMEVKGLGKKTAEKLVQAGVVVNPADLFRLTIDDLLSLEGFAQKSASQLYESIQDAKTNRSLERLVIGMGIPGVGRTSAKALALKVGSIEGLLDIASSENGDELLLSVPNFAEQSASVVFEHLKLHKVTSELKALQKHVNLRYVVDDEEIDALEANEVRSISGKTFVFTGRFVSMSRPQVMKWIKRSGGRVTSSVSSKTDYVVSGLEPGNKYFKAQRLKVKTVQEAEFFQFFDISSEQAERFRIRPQDMVENRSEKKGPETDASQ